MAEQFTEKDVELVAEELGACLNGRASDGRGWFRTAAERQDAFSHAEAILRVLAETGRLLPTGVEITEKFGVMGDEPIGRREGAPRSPIVMGKRTRAAAEEYIAEQSEQWPEYKLRLVSHWASEWVELPTDA